MLFRSLLFSVVLVLILFSTVLAMSYYDEPLAQFDKVRRSNLAVLLYFFNEVIKMQKYMFGTCLLPVQLQ